MSSTENQQHAFPAAPPSLSAGDHEMRNYYATQNVPRPSSDQTSYLTPYLGLRARLSQVWINRWTILILLVLIRALLAIRSVNTNLTSAKREALSACTGVENVGSTLASMPHYMSSGVNELTASGIEKAINGLMSMLLLSITVLEEIFVFYINLLTSTYICLFTFAVGGSLHVAIDVAEDVGDFLNSTAKGVGTELGDAVEGFQKAMNKFTGAIEDVGSFFTGKDVDVPDLNLNSSIAKLDTLQLPSGYDKGLDKLNDSIPTFAEVHNATNTALRFPFEEVKKLLNESMGKYTMNRSMFNVPPKEKLTFCSDDDGINDFFDGLADVITLAKKVFLSVLIIAAILVCVPMAYREVRRWRLQEERASAIKHINDPMDAVYIVSRPYTANLGVKVSNHFSSTRARTLVRWTIAYATTTPALFVLCLAIAGLLGCLCQYILLQAIRKEVPELTQKVDAFADKVQWSLNNASLAWAVDTNRVINTTNTKINEDIFGWVNITTGAVNNTLNIFVDGMNDAINDTFGGTILEDPVKEVVNCLITLKIEGIQKGLTWVSDHAHVDFPMVKNDTFSLGTMDNDTSSGNSSMLDEPDSIDAGDQMSRAILFVVRALEEAVRQEAIISTGVLLIWVLIVFIGLLRAGYMLAHAGMETAPPDQYPGELKMMPPQSFSATHASRTSFSRRNSSISSRVPTYEQATSATTVGTDDNSANRLNGQSYTLSPRKFQLSDHPGVTSPILSSGFSPSEKVGFVGAQNVEAATRRPTHIRASSHGNIAEGTSPVDKSPTSPQRSNTHLHSQDPFADHAR
ncbi:hypothetical protein E4T39_07499 [Aureobasidium subglaciale]|nr:hypothetical protein E4T39_07499 [Aureobasidium subglaciale]